MRAECLPITAIPHATDLFKDYLLHFDKVRDFFPAPPFDSSTITDSAKTLDYPDDRRAAVANILERQNKNWGAGAKTLANIECLRSGAHAIVTGHQATLFGGPLFSLLKAITIAKLAAETTPHGLDAVPIFWLATEDHDLAEVSSVTLLAKPEMRTLTVATNAAPDQPVSAVKFDENISAV